MPSETPLTSAELFGMSKRINNELEELPIQTHSALLQLLNVALQHRNLCEQRKEKLAQDARQQQALDNQSAMVKMQQQQMERQEQEKAAEIKPHLVTQ